MTKQGPEQLQCDAASLKKEPRTGKASGRMWQAWGEEREYRIWCSRSRDRWWEKIRQDKRVACNEAQGLTEQAGEHRATLMEEACILSTLSFSASLDHPQPAALGYSLISKQCSQYFPVLSTFATAPCKLTSALITPALLIATITTRHFVCIFPSASLEILRKQKWKGGPFVNKY